MRRLLAIETSSETCSVALDADGEVREFFQHAPMKHAELILPAVSSLLADAGIRASNLDVIAFGRGPGSFTSLRIGIGVVHTIDRRYDEALESLLDALAMAEENGLEFDPESVTGPEVIYQLRGIGAEIEDA